MTHGDVLRALALLLVLIAGLRPGSASEAPGGGATADGYAGSAACAGCHTYIYDRWRTTRHSHSVRTPEQAREAGYPLPQKRRGGADLSVRDWSDLSYVIGGRQRIGYVDSSGRVLDTSYHHRVGRWDVFPVLDMSVCATCHYTGVGKGDAHPDNPALPGRWVERNIGCEACHGPGAQHTKTLEKVDIKRDPSSRVCGQCHTEVGKILPKGELHATHDLVQTWNQDPHVTGARRHSHSGFCARCHSPFDATAAGATSDAHRNVFAEDKLNITCIGCHDPHALTHADYSPRQVSLAPPLPVRSHTYEGNDADFTTTDFREWKSAEEACLRCHRGADRVDLDHANASCVDCHNTYKRNHSRETRQFHDSNRPRLTCRSCHDDADHLMAILYEDVDFLAPSGIHNLRTLPRRVRERHGFTYASLKAPGTVADITGEERPQEDQVPVATPSSISAPAAVERSPTRTDDSLQRLLARQPHLGLAGDPRIAALRAALLAAPRSTSRHLYLANAYVEANAATPALELVTRAFRLESSRLLLELPLAGAGDDAAARDTESSPALTALLAATRAEDDAMGQWLAIHIELTGGHFEAATRLLEHAPNAAVFGLQRGLAAMGEGRLRSAREWLTTNVEMYPEHHASLAALGLLHLNRRRTAPAIEALEKAVALAPGDGSTRLLLGHAHAARGDLVRAVEDYRGATRAEPGFLQAYFAMGTAYQAGGRPDAAANIYQAVIDREPALFEARYALANVLKLLSDSMAFRLEHQRESRPPVDIPEARWNEQLSQWRRQIDEYRNLALAELGAATRIRPAALDVYRQIAEIYRRSGRLEDAERFYGWLSQRQPHVWLHRYRLGTIHVARGRYAQAVELLRAVVATAPTDGDARLALGLALARDARFAEAVTVLKTATLHEPFNPALYTNLGAAYAHEGQFEKAESALSRSLELHSFPLPRVHLTHTNLALVYLHTGRNDEAIVSLRRALHRFPAYPLARESLHRLTQSSTSAATATWPAFVFNDGLERFGEVTTVAAANE